MFSFKKTDSSIVISRSQKEAINLNKLLGDLGGGGHSMAASVMFKDKSGEKTLEEVNDIEKSQATGDEES